MRDYNIDLWKGNQSCVSKYYIHSTKKSPPSIFSYYLNKYFADFDHSTVMDMVFSYAKNEWYVSAN